MAYIRFPFANVGDKTPIPEDAQPDGSVSYEIGFGSDYEADPMVDPNAKPVPRAQSNQLYNDIMTAIQKLQQQAVPDFITTADNGGTPYSYSKYNRVFYSGVTYISLVDANVDLPSVTASWVPDAPGSIMIFSTGVGTVADGVTTYLGANQIASTTESNVTIIMPFPGILKKFYGYCVSAAAGTRTYTVRKNGVDTAITGASTSTARVASDLVNQVTFVAGDEIDIKLVTSGGATTSPHKASIEIIRTI